MNDRPRFLRLRVRPKLVFHGYDAQHRELLVEQPEEPFVDKLLNLDRLLSATERLLLVAGPEGRQYYWEYEGGLAALEASLGGP